MDSNNQEYSYSQKARGTWIIYKLLLLLFYISYTAIYLYVIIKIAFVPLGALIPLTLWIIIHFTWHFTSPDYKYTIDAGVLTFYVSYGKKSHEKLKIHIKDALAIAPRDEIYRHSDGVTIEKVYSALPSKNETDAYAILFRKKTKGCILFLKVTRDIIKSFSFYNKKTVI